MSANSSYQPLLGPAVITRCDIIEVGRAEVCSNLGVMGSMRAVERLSASAAYYTHITPYLAAVYNDWPINVESLRIFVVGVRLLRILPLTSS